MEDFHSEDEVISSNYVFKNGNSSRTLNISSKKKSEEIIDELKMKNNELNHDIAILKRLVYMLNVELELRDVNYQTNRDKQERPIVCDSTNSYNLLKKSDINMIEPLLCAFEQTKEEKEELLSKYKQSFDEFSKRCKEIVAENIVLREQLQESKTKVESTYDEWKKLHAKFLLVEEHNQLLTRQNKLFQNKIRGIESVYRNTLKQLENDKKELCEHLESVKSELLLLKGRLSAVSEIRTQATTQMDHLKELNTYSVIISEVKNLASELKIHHANELQILRDKIQFLESQKCNLDILLAKVTSERDHLQGYISAMRVEATRKLNIIPEAEEQM